MDERRRTIIVTGASKGIGRGIATALARHGYDLGLIARSSAELDELRREIEALGGRAAVAVADLRSWESASRAVDALAAELGGIDGLVNNAGLVTRQDAMSISLDDWHAMVDTNLNGVFYMVRATVPHLRRRGGGHIINISSISGRMPLAGGSGYAATKYAVTGFSESLFLELRDEGIHVAVVFPGSVDSQSHRHAPDEDTAWKVQPEEVGDACHAILAMPPGTAISRLEIRPLRRPPR